MKIIDRIYEYIEYKKISVARFERENVLSTGYLAKMKARSADIGETMLNNIIENSPDISLQWLVLGIGPMLKSAEKTKKEETPGGSLANDLATFNELLTRYGELYAQNKALREENDRLRAQRADMMREPES